MFMPPVRRLALAALLPLTLAGCLDNGYGHGYGGLSVGSGYYGYDRPSYRYAPYYGWHDNYYYPGRGYYVWDRRGDRYRWNDRQRRYWQDRRREWRHHNRGDYRENWSGYRRDWHRDDRRDRRDRRNDDRLRRYWQDRLGGD